MGGCAAILAGAIEQANVGKVVVQGGAIALAQGAIVMDAEGIVSSGIVIESFQRPDEIEPVFGTGEDVNFAGAIGGLGDRLCMKDVQPEVSRKYAVNKPCSYF